MELLLLSNLVSCRSELDMIFIVYLFAFTGKSLKLYEYSENLQRRSLTVLRYDRCIDKPVEVLMFD